MCSTSHGRNGILFIGRGLAYCKTEETDLLRSKRGPIDREGCGVPQNGGNGLVLERYSQNRGPVHREGCGVPQNGTPRDTVHLHHRPPPASTGYCSSTIDLLQPPPTAVHPRADVHPASTARSSIGYCSTSPLHGGPIKPPLHGLLFIQPSTGYCSTNPPPATVQPALHGVLFIQPSTGSCSSTGSIDRGTVHPAATASTTTGSCSSNPHRELFIQTPQQRSFFIQRQDRSASVSTSSEGIARSGSVNNHQSIARV